MAQTVRQMSFLRGLTLFLVLLALVGIPIGSLAFVIFGGLAWLSGFLAAVVLFVVVAVISEREMLARHPARPLDPGMRRSLDRVLEEEFRHGENLPAFRVTVVSEPELLVIRSVGGKGLVLMSRGLVNGLDERRLRALISLSLREIENPSLPWASAAAVLAGRLIRLAPSRWVRTVRNRTTARGEMDLGVIKGAVFLVLYPWIRILEGLAGEFTTPAGAESRGTGNAVRCLNDRRRDPLAVR